MLSKRGCGPRWKGRPSMSRDYRLAKKILRYTEKVAEEIYEEAV
jgi:hypothetical protein